MVCASESIPNAHFWKELFAVAFRLYDLNHTGYIERHEVSFLSQFLRWNPSQKFMIIYLFLQLKDMVLAHLYESNLTLEDDFVEAIVDKVRLKYNVNNVLSRN